MANLTIAVFLQTILATFAFAVFLVPPGYLLAEASNLFGARTSSAAEKLLLGVVLSFAVTPILSVLLTRVFSYAVTLSVFVLLACIATFVFARQFRSPARTIFPLRRNTLLFLAALFTLFLLVQLSLVDVQVGHRLYISYTSFDQSIRVPLIEAAARTGVPPLNPFYAIGYIPRLRYFYYWYVVCALPMRLLGISAKACFNASAFWSGVGLFSIIPLFLKHLLHETDNLRRKSVIGVALLGVTGLDLIPYIAQSMPPHVATPDMEWWDPNQVTSWVGSMLWVPHHVASLVACMAGMLLFSQIEEESPPGQRFWLAIFCGMAFASAAGLSVYVTLTFALFVIYWTLDTLARKHFRAFLAYLAAGVVTLLLSWPYLLDLYPRNFSAASSAESAPRIAYFGLREGPAIVDPLRHLHLHNPVLMELAKLPALLITYMLEFGFFAVIMFLAMRRDMAGSKPLSRQRRMVWTMFAVCLLAMTVLRSDTTGFNDLGFRGILVVQFVLLILAAPLLYDYFRVQAFAASRPRVSWTGLSLLFTLILGVSGAAYQLLALRFYAPLAEAGRVTRDETFLGVQGFGERTYWIRDGFARLDKLTNSDVHVQYNPGREQIVIAHLYSTRQAAMGDSYCESNFGGDLQQCRKAVPSIFMIFNNPEALRAQNLDVICDKYHLNVLVANDVDPVWSTPGSWVWSRPTLVSNPYFRAVRCGNASR